MSRERILVGISRVRTVTRGSLSFRLTLAFMAVALLGILVTAAAVGQAVSRRFDLYLYRHQRFQAEQVALRLARAYEQGGFPLVVQEADRLAGVTDWRCRLVDEEGRVIWQNLPPGFPRHGPPWRQVRGGPREEAIPLLVGGNRVGTLYVAVPGAPFRQAEEAAFLGGVRRALWTGGILAAVAAMVVGLGMARSMTRPLASLCRAAERLREGDTSQQVREEGSEEIRALARAFNHLARSLARQEELRRQLAADLAHEIRTPLAVLRGHIEAMQDGVWEATPENLAALHAELMRLVRLVGDLEKLNEAESQALTPARSPVDIGELARRVVTAFAPLFEQKGVALELEVASVSLRVRGDEDKLSQVLWNLLSNALKFTPTGGKVKVLALASEREVRLEVRDTGPGIPPEDLPYLFERTFRLRRARGEEEGSGLGLAIAQALAKAQGGRLEARSEPGRGSAFALILPPLR